ncbi:MAG: hypothetical protein A2X86_17035 [Bdellovibrionales bacterium GWA2_49_15]|nr:MAG: hypothetical protein A2X86_17035 [Bdellovibrionales bacterium GWA2_49_15]
MAILFARKVEDGMKVGVAGAFAGLEICLLFPATQVRWEWSHSEALLVDILSPVNTEFVNLVALPVLQILKMK